MSSKITTKSNLIQSLELRGLEIAPSQVCGSIRLVPLLRTTVRGDLRLARRAYKDDDYAVVSLDGPPEEPGMAYAAFVPHGLILSWGNDGKSVNAARGTQIATSGFEGKRYSWGDTNVRLLSRMVKREGRKALRLLPLHLAMEGFLGLYFSGPDYAWSEYSQYALSHGLGSRSEMVYGGNNIAGFEDALRTFEIHEGQVGMLIFVADKLASAFVVPTPDDYRLLQRTLLTDFYGELIYYYAVLYNTVLPFHATFDTESINSVTDLRTSLAQVRQEWAAFQGFMAHDLLGRPAKAEFTYQAGPFTLQRFITDLDPARENHIGEAILRENGELEYLKTFHLSGAQTRRAYLLRQLSEAKWHLDTAAQNLQTPREELVRRLENAGFGYLLTEPVRAAARKRATV